MDTDFASLERELRGGEGAGFDSGEVPDAYADLAPSIDDDDFFAGAEDDDEDDAPVR